MSKHQDRLEQKSPVKPEIGKDSRALDENDLDKVTGGEISIPYGRIEFVYKEQKP